jgi:hypothetical protein
MWNESPSVPCEAGGLLGFRRRGDGSACGASLRGSRRCARQPAHAAATPHRCRLAAAHALSASRGRARQVRTNSDNMHAITLNQGSGSHHADLAGRRVEELAMVQAPNSRSTCDWRWQWPERCRWSTARPWRTRHSLIRRCLCTRAATSCQSRYVSSLAGCLSSQGVD